MTDRTWNEGDIVGISDAAYPGRWKITKRNPRNWHLTGLDGQPRPLAAPPWTFTDPPEAVTTTAAGTAETVPLPVYFDPGAFVTCAIPKPKYDGVTLVVLADKGRMVNCVPLGGHPGRDGGYYRIPRGALTLADPATVLREGVPHTAYRPHDAEGHPVLTQTPPPGR